MIVVVAPPSRARGSGDGREALVATAHVRLMILAILFGAGVLAILGKLAFLAWSAGPASPRDLTNALVPARGDIVDRNGTPLARSIDAWTIAIHPNQVIGDKAALAQKLAELIPERSQAQYYALLNSRIGFAFLKRRALPELVNQMNALGEPAIEFQR